MKVEPEVKLDGMDMTMIDQMDLLWKTGTKEGNFHSFQWCQRIVVIKTTCYDERRESLCVCVLYMKMAWTECW